MIPITENKTGWHAWSADQADAARQRFHQRERRLRIEKEEQDARLAAKAAAKLNEVNNESALSPEELAEKNRKRAIIEAAIERARLQKAAQEQKKS
jgi:electron transport complex protein RnfB